MHKSRFWEKGKSYIMFFFSVYLFIYLILRYFIIIFIWGLDERMREGSERREGER